MVSYQYAYLITDLLYFLPIWLALFLYRKDLRKQMLMVSLLTGIGGPIAGLWYTQDYWRPEVITGGSMGIEDVLFGFFIGGIASIIYEAVRGKHSTAGKNLQSYWIPFAVIVSAITSFNLLYLADVHSIYASLVALLLAAGLMIFYRPDLLTNSIMSGLLIMAVMVCGYLLHLEFFSQTISRWWLLNNLSGIFIHGIPIEEWLWAFCWGAVIGPAYKFVSDQKF